MTYSLDLHDAPSPHALAVIKCKLLGALHVKQKNEGGKIFANGGVMRQHKPASDNYLPRLCSIRWTADQHRMAQAEPTHQPARTSVG